MASIEQEFHQSRQAANQIVGGPRKPNYVSTRPDDFKQSLKRSRDAAEYVTNPEARYKSIIESRFPIMKQYKYHVYPDKAVSNGYGDIETFAGDWDKDVVHYNNGFNLDNRYPGETSIVFNPEKVTEEDIALDALHIAREQDPVYRDLLKRYEEEASKTDYGDFHGDGPEEDFHNGVDGVLRGSMYRGDRIRARYAPREEYEELYKRYPELGKAYRDLRTYLEGGYIEPAVVTATRKK